MKACLQASKLILLKRNIQLTIWQTEWEASIWNFAIVFSTPENLLVEISGALGTQENHFLSKNVFLRKCCGVSQKQWMLELSNLCYCVQHPWKLTSRNFWSSRNTWKPHSKLKHVFRKCSGVSQKLWMLVLSNLCHCVQHPWKLTSRDFWSSRNTWKPLSQQKSVFEKMLWGISEMVNASAFKPLPLYSAPLKNY